MALRKPIAFLDKSNAGEVGAGSVAGVVAIPFLISQDTDSIVVKFTASTVGGGVSATLQTTDDGGTTWYDVARTSVISNSAGEQNAQWLTGTTIATGVRTAATFAAASIISAGVGSSAASTLAQGQVSGLPLLSDQARVALVLPAALTASTVLRTRIYLNNQSASA